jgi:outer membrane protein assembly factor BamB
MPTAPHTRGSAGLGPGIVATEEYRRNWPQLRGPGGNGIAAPQNPPVEWDGPTGRNVLWKASVPLPGRGSPVVWNDRVFLSGGDAARRAIYCWNADTGELLWQVAVRGAARASEAGSTPESGWAASTMVTNGRAVFAAFATGDLAALDFGGNALWTVYLGSPKLNHGYASSLALYGDTILVQLDQEEGGKLLAISAADGSVAWATDRKVSSCWTSPVVVDTENGWRVFINGTPFFAAYDLEHGGAELWRVPEMVGENAASPAYASGRVFAANQLLSLAAADARTGNIVWQVYEDFPDVASPLATGPFLYMATSYGVVTCLDASDGRVQAHREFAAGFYASPILAGGRIYALDRSGVMRLLSADGRIDLIGSPAIGEPTDATPAFRDGSIFIRGERTLFCVREGGDSR